MPLSLSGSLSRLRRVGRKPNASPREPNTTFAAPGDDSPLSMLKNRTIYAFSQNKSGEIFSVSEEFDLFCISSHICRQCQLIFQHLPSLSSGAGTVRVKHHANKTTLEQSARTCGLCDLFILAYNLINPKYEYEFFGKPGVVYIVVSPAIEGRRWLVRWCYPSDEDGEDDTRGCSIVIDPARGVDPSVEISNFSTSTRDGLHVAKSWLDACQSHEACNTTSETLPTRLLDLTGTPRLCLGANLGPIKYATLSHCWGSIPFQTLERENLQQFFTQIPTSALQKTFQEAIQTATYMGLQYLWIDSLCIIQDSEEDWRVESSMMASVYGNSSLNISASGARDGSQGCFFPRNKTRRCQVQVENDFFDCYPRNLHLALEIQPLYFRGWTLQERILPRRTLHCTRGQLFWECNQTRFCEILPTENPMEEAIRYGDRLLDKSATPSDQWHRIVARYSACMLTNPRDKLVALSGLARRFQNTTNETYVAGLWKEHLQYDLCWWVLSESQASNSEVYRAPSWSWAHLDGQVNFISAHQYNINTDILNFHASVLDVQLELKDQENTFGEILSGTLRLACEYLLPATIEKGDDYFQFSYIGGEPSSVEVEVYLDTLNISNLRRELDVHILPLVAVQCTLKAMNNCAGLVVRPTGVKLGQYKRIGYYALGDGMVGKVLTRPYIEAVQKGDSQVVEDELYVEVCVDQSGKKQRIIELV
ncbi:HET-domain-containing protein [Stipitochalara longipes BDJ]|nr:HET-domain-containing protein [Stipitochalara longipes BDJ]